MHDATSSHATAARPRIAFVLGGGAARGAYEVGVAQHLFDDVAHDLGAPLPIDIFCGTSVGAINACALAAHADEQRTSGMRLGAHWTGLELRTLLRLDRRGLIETARGLLGSRRPPDPGARRRGGVLDPSGVEQVVARAIPFTRIGEQLRARRVQAVTVSTTHVGSGSTVVFVQRAAGAAFDPHDGSVARPVTLALEHVLASAAIPFVFPAVRIDGSFYCDGALRQAVPLSPAHRLGADRILVVSTRYVAAPTRETAEAREADFPGPLYLFGKAIHALTTDRVDDDIDRLEHVNRLLARGVRHYGPGFLRVINGEDGHATHRLRTRPLRTLQIRPSQDLSRLAADFVRSPRFGRRVGGMLGRLLRRLAEGDADADLLSVLLFDGDFAAELIALGRADARARHEELCAFFSSHSFSEPAPAVA